MLFLSFDLPEQIIMYFKAFSPANFAFLPNLPVVIMKANSFKPLN